jgi:hypothetical protein
MSGEDFEGSWRDEYDSPLRGKSFDIGTHTYSNRSVAGISQDIKYVRERFIGEPKVGNGI